MDIVKLEDQLELLMNLIEETASNIEESNRQGLNCLPALLESIQKVLPDLFYFIEQTQIGSKEMILSILQDITDAVQKSDEVLLLDSLIFGLQSLLREYCDIINEALYE